MIVSTNEYAPTSAGKVKRVFAFDDDGTILYSWVSDMEKNTLYIRSYNTFTDTDVVILVIKHCCDVINTSLSPDRKVIGLTTWNSSRKSQHNETIMKNQQSVTASLPSHATDAKPFGASSRCNNSSSTDESSADIWNEIHDEEYPKYSKESYTSYIAEVYPTGWSMKFNTRRKLVQRVLFTNWLNVKLNGDLKLTSYQVLLAMHRESIGLYNVVIEDMQYGKMKTSQSSLLLEQPSRTRVFGKPTSEVLSSHAIWNQWEPHTQRLWYMVPITNKSLKKHQKLSSEEIAGLPTKCNIVCLQFYETVPHQKVLEVQLCLHLSRFALYNTSSLNRHYDLDPTVSSIELNMRVVTMCESGLTCVCWQEKQSKHNVGNRLYSIAILNKDILIHHPYQEDIGDVPISFYPLGSMLIVQAAGKFLHIYDTNAISCNEIRMQSGLFHLLLSGDLLPPIANHHLEYIKRHYRPVADSESDPNHYSDSQESILSSVGSYDCATICFDLTRRCFLSLELCSQAFCELFTSDRTTTKNKVYMTRQAVLYPQGCNASSNLLSIVLQTIITFPAQHYITPMLCQLLTAMACAELADYKHAIPTTMIPLLPSSLSSYALNWLLTEKELSQDDVVYESMYGTCENLCSSVKQYIAALSSDHKLTAIDRVVGKSDTQIMDSNKSTVWYRVFSACEQGLYTEYDLDSIRDELTILKRLKKDKDEKSTNILDNLPSRLMDLFHKRFGKPLSSSVDSMLDLEDDYQTTTMLSFLDKHERIETSDYIMVLTTEKLEDHFSAHIPASSDPTSSLKLSRISRDYVSAQMRAVHHVLTLLMLKSGVEDPQSRLYTPATEKEQNFLLVLNQFQIACSVCSFPLPHGFHTYLTCLTFRCMLARYTWSTENNKDEVKTKIDTDMLSSQFFCQVDQEVVHLTNEFVSRALEQLGNKADFSHIVYEVLKHAHGMEVDDDEVAAPLFSGLHLWHDPMARTHLAKYHLKDLYQKYATSHVGIKSPSNTDTSINEKSVSSYLTEIAESPKLQARNSSVVSPKSTDINACSNDQSTFPPLSAFLQFIKDVEANQLPNHALPGKSPQSVLGVVKSCMLPTTIETVPSPDSADSDYIV